jgi:hypothetical protein
MGWFGFKRAEGQSIFEQFNLNLITPGVYSLTGSGPGYTTMGECLISSQGRIGFALTETTATTNNLRSTIGSFSNTAKSITTKTAGVQDDGNVVGFNPTMLK